MTSIRAWPGMLAIVIAIGFAVSCGSNDQPQGTPDPFEGVLREGIYTRTRDSTSYEIRFGVGIGRYVLLINGTEQRRGTYTHVTTEDKPALAFIDEGEFTNKCLPEQEPGIYHWRIKDNKLSLDVFEDKCEPRISQLESGDWLFQGDLPSATP